MTQLSMNEALLVLQNGTIELEGLLPWSSNYAFLVQVCEGDAEVRAVYKPLRGERPLWDFPQGTLCHREQATYLVAEALGWHLIPPTVMREGQHGMGSVQLFIDHDPEEHYFTFEGDPVLRPQLQQIALLDVIINNADRKAGHVLLQTAAAGDEPGQAGRLWGIDHGICFHTDYKLRTVIWEFSGEGIAGELMSDLDNLQQKLNKDKSGLTRLLGRHLSQPEIAAIGRRLERLRIEGTFPDPGPGRHYPWPPI